MICLNLKIEETKDYDINEIIEKAKQDKNVNYEAERFNKSYNGNDIINEIKEKYQDKEETREEKELLDLINTITILEKKNANKDADLLDMKDEKIEAEDTEPEIKVELPKEDTTEFYTGKLKVKEEDFDDFKDMQKDIKSNSLLIKVLVFIFILIALAIGIVVANNIFDLGLF